MSKQPKDDDNDPIPLLSYRPAKGHQITTDIATSVRSQEFSASVRVISIFATENCFIELGDNAVTADKNTSHFIPASMYLDISLGSNIIANQNYKYLSVISLSTAGLLFISERE